jgi:hypothetical protein
MVCCAQGHAAAQPVQNIPRHMVLSTAGPAPVGFRSTSRARALAKECDRWAAQPRAVVFVWPSDRAHVRVHACARACARACVRTHSQKSASTPGRCAAATIRYGPFRALICNHAVHAAAAPFFASIYMQRKRNAYSAPKPAPTIEPPVERRSLHRMPGRCMLHVASHVGSGARCTLRAVCRCYRMWLPWAARCGHRAMACLDFLHHLACAQRDRVDHIVQLGLLVLVSCAVGPLINGRALS